MGISSTLLPCSPPHLSPLPSPRIRTQAQAQLKVSCSLRTSPKPLRTKRQNYLRRKLPKYPSDTPQPTHKNGEFDLNSPRLVSQEIDKSETFAGEKDEVEIDPFDPVSSTHVSVPQEMEKFESFVREDEQIESIDPFGGPAIGLVLRFGAIFLVQTVFAVLFFGLGEILKERKEFKMKNKKGKIEREVQEKRVEIDPLEYERKVKEIRKMAKVVREKEKRGFEVSESESEDEDSLPLPWKPRSREGDSDSLLGLEKSSLLNLLSSPGFRAKISGSLSSNLENGSKVEDFSVASQNQTGKKEVTGDSKYINSSTDETNQRSKSGANTSLLSRHGESKEKNQIHTSKNGSIRELSVEEKLRVKSPINQNISSSGKMNKVESKSDFETETKDFEEREHRNKEENNTSNGQKLWWFKLPYVLGIYLDGGSNENAPKGLYSLQVSPSIEDERNSLSFAVTFQDRGDALNFCYLLESFFEGLGDISADIIPLTTPELKEAVESNEMKLIVVKKGQIKMYAGQPFEEIETILHSLVDSEPN